MNQESYPSVSEIVSNEVSHCQVSLPQHASRLFIIRGPSGSGKSTLSSALLQNWKEECSREVVYIEQDNIRNEMMKYVRDRRGASCSMIYQCAATALDAKYDVLIEGILNMKHYGPMLEKLVTLVDPANLFICYLDVPLEETKRRHNLRAKKDVFPSEKLDEWFSSAQPTGLDNEIIFPASNNVDEMVEIVDNYFTHCHYGGSSKSTTAFADSTV